jgi:hypothetical protein
VMQQLGDADPEQCLTEGHLGWLRPHSGLHIWGDGYGRRRRFEHILHDVHYLLHHTDISVVSARVVVAVRRPVLPKSR